jgi:hypothetical protein
MNKAKIIADLEKRRKPVPYLVAAPDYSRTVMIVISLLPPSFEGTVNFSTLRWHGVGDGAGGTELTTGGESVGGSPNASAG